LISKSHKSSLNHLSSPNKEKIIKKAINFLKNDQQWSWKLKSLKKLKVNIAHLFLPYIIPTFSSGCVTNDSFVLLTVFKLHCFKYFSTAPTLISCKLIRNGIQDQSMVLPTFPIEAGVEFAKLCSCSSTGALFFHIWRLVGG